MSGTCRCEAGLIDWGGQGGKNASMWRAAVALVAIASSGVYVALAALAITTGLAPIGALLWLLLSAPPMVAAAGYLMWRRPANSIGALLMVTAVATVVLPTILEVATILRFQDVGREPWMWAPMWAAVTLGIVGTSAGAAMLGLLPDGRLRYRHDRLFLPIAVALAAIPALGLLTNEFVQVPTFQFSGLTDVASPSFVPALAWLGGAFAVAANLAYSVILLGIWALFVRYRRSAPRQQRQLRWVLLAGAIAVIANVVPTALGQLGIVPELQHELVGFVTFLPTLLVPLAVVATVMEPPWIDVDIVIRRSFVFGTLSLLILLIYVAAAAAIGLAAGADLPLELAIVLTVVVAVALQPLRRRLQAWADRRVFGAPATRYAALAEFGANVDDVTDPGELVGQLAATAHQALRLTWATVTIDGIGVRTVGRRIGPPAADIVIGHRGTRIGRLECGEPVGGSLAADDLTLLRALSGQAGLAVANARLATRIVETQEQERRRIERNLHDGAQQELVALVARLGLARSRLESGTLEVEAIDELQAAVRRILSEIRELAQGIHPSIVSDGGILAAVEERCASLPLEVTLEAEPGIRRARFADQVEGAAYFLVVESLANVLKHAAATRATVTLRRQADRLSIVVSDDGAGFDPANAVRRGLAGLEDRFTALGGTVHVASRPGGGTSVTASLPVEP